MRRCLHSNDIDDKSNDDADDNEEEDHDDDNEEEDHDDDDDGDECSYYFDNSVGTKNIDYPHHHHQHHPLFDVCCVNVFMEVTSLPSSLCPQSPFTPWSQVEGSFMLTVCII